MKFKFTLACFFVSILITLIFPSFTSILKTLALPNNYLTAQTTWKQQTIHNLFSFEYPSHWFIEIPPLSDISKGGTVILTNFKIPSISTHGMSEQQIKTDISIQNLSFQESINSAVRYEDSKKIKTEKLVINGREAFRIWGSDSMEGEPYTSTLIRYQNNKTLTIYSFYTSSNQAAPSFIKRIHNSVKIIQ